MGEIALHIRGLGKRYAIGRRRAGNTLRDALGSLWRAARPTPGSLARVDEPFVWALRDVSFDVHAGEIVGVIGRNGAGKSTLLKILSRITRPTTGAFEIAGRVGSLLEVGTGFHPELTGRENVFLNGAILGMKKRDIERKLDEIVAFSGVEKFIDTPVKHYSSGMHVRLAFAVAAHLEPEILMVDEVLAVGDVAFQKKCLDRIGEVTSEGRTVLFVSHNLAAVGRLCQRVLWMEGGRVRSEGPPDEIVAGYLTAEATLLGERTWEGGVAHSDVHEFRLRAVRVRNDRGDVVAVLDARFPFSVEIEYAILEPLPFCRVGIILETIQGVTVVVAYDADEEQYTGPRPAGVFVSRCVVPGHLLSPGRYIVSVNAGMMRLKNLVTVDAALSFDIAETGAVGAHLIGPRGRRGVIRPQFEWQVEAHRDATVDA